MFEVTLKINENRNEYLENVVAVEQTNNGSVEVTFTGDVSETFEDAVIIEAYD